MINEYDDNSTEVNKESWHLSKSLNVSIIVAVLAQTAGIVWSSSASFHQLSVLEIKIGNTITKTESKLADKFLQIQITNNDETDNEIKEALKEGFKETNSKLDRLIERL